VDDSADGELLDGVGIASFDDVTHDRLDRLHEAVTHVDFDAREGSAVAAADLPRVGPHAVLDGIEPDEVAAGGRDRCSTIVIAGRLRPYDGDLDVGVSVRVTTR
jgi:hypothetical protein